jgi:hypothetical protein
MDVAWEQLNQLHVDYHITLGLENQQWILQAIQEADYHLTMMLNQFMAEKMVIKDILPKI